MAASVEELLRASAMSYGHIQLFRDDAGWAVSVQHYHLDQPAAADGFTLGIFDDPVDGLRKALIEDDRRTRDLERKYAASKKGAPEPAPLDPQVDLEDYLAETAATAAPSDPMADMFG